MLSTFDSSCRCVLQNVNSQCNTTLRINLINEMDANDKLDTKSKDVGDTLSETTAQIQEMMKREMDSIDDFEHLGHDISPLKESGKNVDKMFGFEPTREILGEINKGVESAENVASSLADELNFDPLQKDSLFNIPDKGTMDSNLLELADTFPDRKEADAKLDKFLSEISSLSAPTEKELKENVKERFEDVKSASQNFMDMERGTFTEPPKITASTDLIERFTDSEPEDDYKPSIDSTNVTEKDAFKLETFKDFEDFELPKASETKIQPKVTEPPKIDKPVILPEPVKNPEPIETPKPILESKTPELVKITEPVIVPEPVIIPKDVPAPVKTPEPIKISEPVKIPEPMKIQEPLKKPEPIKVQEPKQEVPLKKDPEIKKKETKTKFEVKTEAEAMFCKMGLDSWFQPEKLNPKVADLIYWRDPKKSGPVFGGVLIVLLALTYFSLISVVAYLSLLALTGTISFRIYKNIVQAVQKTGDGHPFKELLDTDLSLPQNKVEDVSKIAVNHLNASVVELRRLFLVEDLVDSIKFGVLLWCLTYLGAWFNGMTLIIIAWVALFTLPKVYETNKTQIDANLDICRTKLEEITSKVKAAIPIGKKTEEKKQQ